MVGANAQRVHGIERAVSRMSTISVLVDHPEQIQEWNPSIGIFIDVNPGMDRTGIGPEHVSEILEMAHAIMDSGRPSAGLHYYDGHLGSLEFEERRLQALKGYEQLAQLAGAVKDAGFECWRGDHIGQFRVPVRLPHIRRCSPEISRFVSRRGRPFTAISPSSSNCLNADYRPAALVATRVVSHPRSDLMTCDAGVKAVAVFAGTSQLRRSRQAGAGSAEDVGRAPDAAGAGRRGFAGDRRNSLSHSATRRTDGEQFRRCAGRLFRWRHGSGARHGTRARVGYGCRQLISSIPSQE